MERSKCTTSIALGKRRLLFTPEETNWSHSTMLELNLNNILHPSSINQYPKALMHPSSEKLYNFTEKAAPDKFNS